MSRIELLLITNKPEEAVLWDKAGVDYIFLDLEILGKERRQGHLNTVISRHSPEDISQIRSVISSGKLLVRINPLNNNTSDELEDVISRGADMIMLPMFKSHEEVLKLLSLVRCRCKVYPLIETKEALDDVENLAKIKDVDGYHFGLNDLHIAFGYSFIFEVMLSSSFKHAVNLFREKNITFGFGGISRLGGGVLPADLLLKEHVRLGSKRVILSRSFKSEVSSDDATREIIKIKQFYKAQVGNNLSDNEHIFKEKVMEIVRGID